MPCLLRFVVLLQRYSYKCMAPIVDHGSKIQRCGKNAARKGEAKVQPWGRALRSRYLGILHCDRVRELCEIESCQNADRIQRGAAVQFQTNEAWGVARFEPWSTLMALSLFLCRGSLFKSPIACFSRYSRTSGGFKIRGGRFRVIITITTANT